MSGRAHNREFFYKYASADTALRVIATRSFRWSSPVMFNDPFDHQAGFTLEIDDARFAELFTASIERAVFMDAPVRPGPSPLLFQHLLRLRAIRDRVPRAAMLSQLATRARRSRLICELELTTSIRRYTNACCIPESSVSRRRTTTW